MQKVWSNKPIILACLQAIIDVLGLDICADTIIGNAMRRGVSGGQKKRVTTGVSRPVMCMSWRIYLLDHRTQSRTCRFWLGLKGHGKDSLVKAGNWASGIAYNLTDRMYPVADSGCWGASQGRCWWARSVCSSWMRSARAWTPALHTRCAANCFTGVCSNEGSMRGLEIVHIGRTVLLLQVPVPSRCLCNTFMCVYGKAAPGVSIYYTLLGCVARTDWAVAQIVKYLRDATHELRYTTMVALLQPAPETYELFDDVLLLSDGACVRRLCAAKSRVKGCVCAASLCCMDASGQASCRVQGLGLSIWYLGATPGHFVCHASW